MDFDFGVVVAGVWVWFCVFLWGSIIQVLWILDGFVDLGGFASEGWFDLGRVASFRCLVCAWLEFGISGFWSGLFWVFPGYFGSMWGWYNTGFRGF